MPGLIPYTDSPGAGPYVVFPTQAHQILSNCIHVIGVSVLAYCFARRTELDMLTTKFGWMNMTWTKLCVILVFIDSWIFLALTSVLIHGVGLSYSVTVCSLGIYSCIIFYCGSKASIYFFLVERTWIVWSAGEPKASRLRSRPYLFCFSIVLAYIVIFLLMILGRISELRRDGSCVIGVRYFASIPLLSYDLFVNIFLTMTFIVPLVRGAHISKKLRYLAWRTLLAAGVALTTSSVNIAILVCLEGRQLGWVCLGSCSTDVTINAIALYWVTAGSSRASGNTEFSLPTLRVPLTFVQQATTYHEERGDGLGQATKDTETTPPPMPCPCHYRVVLERVGMDVEVPVLTRLKPVHIDGQERIPPDIESGAAENGMAANDSGVRSKGIHEDVTVQDEGSNATSITMPQRVVLDVEAHPDPIPGPSSPRRKNRRKIWSELRAALCLNRQPTEHEWINEREPWEEEIYGQFIPMKDRHQRLIDRYISGNKFIEVYDDRCTCVHYPRTHLPSPRIEPKHGHTSSFTRPSHRPGSPTNHALLARSNDSNPESRTDVSNHTQHTLSLLHQSCSHPLLRPGAASDVQGRPPSPSTNSPPPQARTLPER